MIFFSSYIFLGEVIDSSRKWRKTIGELPHRSHTKDSPAPL